MKDYINRNWLLFLWIIVILFTCVFTQALEYQYVPEGTGARLQIIFDFKTLST